MKRIALFTTVALGIAASVITLIKENFFDEGHQYVDLGLPSGTLWATCNVGATKPEKYGNYFAWGETKPKEVYNWSTYKYAKISKDHKLDSITKYNLSEKYGIIDSLSVLLPEDDAATANWGNDWRMPTTEDQKELVKECYWVWTNGYNGSDVSGHIVYKAKSTDDKGKVECPGGNYRSKIEYSVSSDAHIFLPAAGFLFGEEFYSVGSYGNYWSSSINDEHVTGALDLAFFSNVFGWNDYSDRYNGIPVRAVRAK